MYTFYVLNCNDCDYVFGNEEVCACFKCKSEEITVLELEVFEVE